MAKTTYTVYATKDWQNSGIQIPAGKRARMKVSGVWQAVTNRDPAHPAWGNEIVATGPGGSWPMTGVHEGCLLYRVGDRMAAWPYEVDTIEVNYSGELEFRPNDHKVDDNEGAVTVEIEIL